MNKKYGEDTLPQNKKYEMLQEIINQELIEIYFQPIISIRSNKVYALEALTRCTYKNRNIPPFILFNLSKELGLNLELDSLSRKKAIEKFKEYYLKNNELLLFLNFESSLIDCFDSKVNDSFEFINIIDRLELPYKNFMIEVKEDEIQNSKALEDFCITFKKKGFSIALDDFGTGSSTFDRINQIRPHLIKIDKSLFVNVKNNLINKEIVKAITNMSHNLGIKVLAEGVEDIDAICTCLKSSINLFQGYYFSKPQKDIEQRDIERIYYDVLDVSKEFKERNLKNISKKRELINVYNLLIQEHLKGLNNVNQLYSLLEKKFSEFKNIEAIYLIDVFSSRQINDTIIEQSQNGLFRASCSGEEHFLKEYYYITLETKQGMYLSQKYISYATGNICKTFAKKIELENSEYILCLDIII